MLVVLYRWKIKEGREAEFREGWRRLTLEIRNERSGWGSRLHKAEDETWIAYAQWKDRETWTAAQSMTFVDQAAATMIRESVETRFPDVFMNVVDDLLLTNHQQPNDFN